MDEETKVPVTVLTGFLGSGKTTLLNHILTENHGKKLAIIENEFGDVGIDDKLLNKNTKMQAEEEIIEMMNGCICCTVRQDLIVVLKKLAARIESGNLKIDGIVIETTGMADPAPVAQTFFVDDAVKSFARLDGIVTLIDAKHIEQHLDAEKAEGAENEAQEQVAFADRMLLNKTDLVTEDDLVRVEARLKAMNRFAPIVRCCKAEVSADSVLDIRGFDLKRTLEMDPEFLVTDGEHVHDQSITSLSIQHAGSLDLTLISTWVNTLLDEKGTDIYRMKGVLAIAHADQKFVYQCVHMVFNGNFEEETWSEGEARESKIVFIGKDLNHEELKAGFEACLATPENLEAKKQALRFGVGDEVECSIEGSWETGEVVGLLTRKEYMDPGVVAPYDVRLEDGRIIFAPVDDPRCIRKLGEGEGEGEGVSEGADPPDPPTYDEDAMGQAYAELYDTLEGDLDAIAESFGGAEKCPWFDAAKNSPPSNGIEWAERMIAGDYV